MWHDKGIMNFDGEMVQVDYIIEGPEIGSYTLILRWPDKSKMEVVVNAAYVDTVQNAKSTIDAIEASDKASAVIAFFDIYNKGKPVDMQRDFDFEF